ncbi:hypothetical protein HK100_005759 [Physocladia obscura]|uniref:GATA-type domain-containing protein n=1 Tax=Physocladia obscura TaxID=109957 RepID=A0AAD5T6N2_9FUNG|nr:hypothetical protein HK100_005759 [Physocladia obscura]
MIDVVQDLCDSNPILIQSTSRSLYEQQQQLPQTIGPSGFSQPLSQHHHHHQQPQQQQPQQFRQQQHSQYIISALQKPAVSTVAYAQSPNLIERNPLVPQQQEQQQSRMTQQFAINHRYYDKVTTNPNTIFPIPPSQSFGNPSLNLPNSPALRYTAGGFALPYRPQNQCVNCETFKTSVWRKDEHGRSICNACGLYKKQHGNDRPASFPFRKSVVRRRKRGGKKGSGEDALVDGNGIVESAAVAATEVAENKGIGEYCQMKNATWASRFALKSPISVHIYAQTQYSKPQSLLSLFRKYSSAVPTSREPESLIDAYPVRLNPNDAEPRHGYFDPFPSTIPWHERKLLMPARLQLAAIAGEGFINNRFNKDSESNANYYPFVFKDGVIAAIPTVFRRLSGWDGNLKSSSQKSAQLQSLIAPTLLASFADIHAKFTAANLRIDFSEKDDNITTVIPTRIWITFGSPENATSTLLAGKVTSRFHYVAFKRAVRKHPTKKIFREICFEYAYDINDTNIDEHDSTDDTGVTVMDEIPGFDWKRKIMLLGHCVGVDSKVSGSSILGYKVSRIDSGDVVHEGDIDLDGFAIRMETTHFVGDDVPDDLQWRIADLDNFLIYPRLLEEEKDL